MLQRGMGGGWIKKLQRKSNRTPQKAMPSAAFLPIQRDTTWGGKFFLFVAYFWAWVPQKTVFKAKNTVLMKPIKKEGGMPALNKVYDAFFCFCAARYAAQRACCCTGMPFRDAGRNFFGFGRFFGNGVSFFLICTFIHLTYARMCDIITGNLRESDALS